MKRFTSIMLTAAITFAVLPTLSAAPPAKNGEGKTEAPSGAVTIDRSAGRNPMVLHKRQSPSNAFTRYNPGPLRLTNENRRPAARLAAAAPNLLGSLTYRTVEAGETFYPALYTVPTIPGQEFEWVAKEVDASYGGVEVNGVYYAVWGYTWGGMHYCLDAFDSSTWEQIYSINIPDVGMVSMDMTYDPVTDKVYGCFYNDDHTGLLFGSADFEAGTRTAIAPVPVQWNACAADADGTLFAIDMNGDLCKVNTADGAITVIGSTGLSPKYMSTGTIDHKTGIFYYALCNDYESALYSIDKSSGAATKLVDFDREEEIGGMFVGHPLAEDLAPAAAENLALNFPGGSLTGTVDFNVPSTHFDGSPTSGTVTYSIKANGDEVATGDAMCGLNASVPVTLSKAGIWEITVTLSNSVGASPTAKIKGFVGNDIPVAPNVTASYDNGVFTISWDAVTESVNGGYIDSEHMTYTVVRYPDNEVVTEGIHETSVTNTIDIPETITPYYFTVTAISGDAESTAGRSETIVVGVIVPPYLQDFAAEDAMAGYAVVNNNFDDKTWTHTMQRLQLDYNQMYASDDWVFTPALKLKKGNLYRVSFDVSGLADAYEERLEVKWGSSQSVSGMTATIREPFGVKCAPQSPLNVSEYIQPDADGEYYIGFHGISEKDMYGLVIDNIAVDAPISGAAPEMVSGLVAAPDYNGGDEVTVSFTAPSTSLDGNQLSSIERIEVFRNDVKAAIKTFDTPAIGAELKFVDKPSESQTIYTYTVVATNDSGSGRPVSASVFVGINIPGRVENVKAAETANEGEVTLSWDAPLTDRDGFPMNPELVVYDIYDISHDVQQVVATGLTETTFTYQAVEPGDEQQLKQWGIFAISYEGASAGYRTMLVPVGAPYATPYDESFADCKFVHDMAVVSVAGYGADWETFDDSRFSNIKSQDDDNGYAAMTAQYIGDAAELFTGKIAMPVDRPGVSFYLHHTSNGSTPNTNTLKVNVTCDGTTETVHAMTVRDLNKPGEWCPLYVPLDKFAGKDARISFLVECNGYGYTYIDNIHIGTLLDKNLGVRDLVVPGRVKPGEPVTARVTVFNSATKPASDYTVNLYRDDRLVATAQGTGLEAGSATTVELGDVVESVAGESVAYHATVTLDGDEDLADNITDKVEARVVMHKHPAVTGLAGVETAGGISLSWSEPDTSGSAVEEVTTDFEDCDAFATELDDWTFTDVDGGGIGGLSVAGQNVEIPGIPQGSAQSWWVWDLDEIQLNSASNGAVSGHSGSKFMVQMYVRNGACDDWAISPELCGMAQTISFYARSYNGNYPESLEVLYSTTGTATDDFISIAVHADVSDEWTEITADLPEGAKHFAIRCISNDCFMLFVDDITYTPAAVGASLSLLGYNIYRDGQRLNDAPIEDTVFVDNDSSEGEHTYSVTAVYDKGESTPVSVSVAKSGVDTIGTALVTISVADHKILISGAEGAPVTVCGTDGRTLFSAYGSAITTVPVPQPGIYLVSIAGDVTKVIVK